MVAVIGSDPATQAERTLAFEVGREIGARGHVLVCGGRGGVMEEACRGAREAGAHTIGILPGDDRSEANPYVEFVIPTGLGHARNTIVARSADALVAIGGRYGTLSEIAFASIARKPVVGLLTWKLHDPSGAPSPVIECSTAAEALDACERAAGKDSPRVH